MPNTTLKNRIRFARGNKANATDTLVPGAPFYDTSTKYLYIGKDSTTPVKNYQVSDSIVAANATNVTDTINNVSIGDIFENDGSTVKQSTDAKNLNDATGTIADGVTATTQAISDTSDKVATDKFVHDALSLIKESVSLVNIKGYDSNDLPTTHSSSSSPSGEGDLGYITLSSENLQAYINGNLTLEICYVFYSAAGLGDYMHVPKTIFIDIKSMGGDQSFDPSTETNNPYTIIDCITSANNRTIFTSARLSTIISQSNNKIIFGINHFRSLKDGPSESNEWVGNVKVYIKNVKLLHI